MYVTCPMCNTRYDLKSSIPAESRATVVCVVCATQLEVEPRGAMYAYLPKVTVRQAQTEQQDSQASIGVEING
jgi:hypothetical protein